MFLLTQCCWTRGLHTGVWNLISKQTALRVPAVCCFRLTINLNEFPSSQLFVETLNQPLTKAICLHSTWKECLTSWINSFLSACKMKREWKVGQKEGGHLQSKTLLSLAESSILHHHLILGNELLELPLMLCSKWKGAAQMSFHTDSKVCSQRNPCSQIIPTALPYPCCSSAPWTNHASACEPGMPGRADSCTEPSPASNTSVTAIPQYKGVLAFHQG